ncbi:LysR family transcriptional regulator [Grimontia marina]|uniref:HTH-type transcriptional regulator CynR n=1 Tax=Grimontia marina TaxID=646534 RepID=A0A128FJ87_9GAMM|nr:LysR family transcriptional regulator [Grimontia marina]CZF86848.1 HTH-type transcriptional regulator CynR [Grimontia marina]
MLNPKWLNTFATLVETGSFTKTAERLYMTQPGVSQHVKKLEDELGETLIFREGKQFELTREGIMLNAFIAEQNQQQADFLARMKDDDPHQGAIRIACSGAMAMKLYPSLLNLQTLHSGLSVQLEAAPADRIRQMLIDNQTDIGITTQKFDQPVFEETLLGEEALCVILPAKVQIPLGDFHALSSLGYIHHPDGKHYADLVLGTNFPEEYRSIEALEHRGFVNQLAQILLPVSKGIGFTVLPESVMTGFEQKEKLTVLTLESPVSQSLFLSQKKYRDLPKRFDKVMELILQATN